MHLTTFTSSYVFHYSVRNLWVYYPALISDHNWVLLLSDEDTSVSLCHRFSLVIRRLQLLAVSLSHGLAGSGPYILMDANKHSSGLPLPLPSKLQDSWMGSITASLSSARALMGRVHLGPSYEILSSGFKQYDCSACHFPQSLSLLLPPGRMSQQFPLCLIGYWSSLSLSFQKDTWRLLCPPLGIRVAKLSK